MRHRWPNEMGERFHQGQWKDPESGVPKAKVCWNWSQQGECKWGTSCRFSHLEKGDVCGGAHPPSGSTSLSTHVTEEPPSYNSISPVILQPFLRGRPTPQTSKGAGEGKGVVEARPDPVVRIPKTVQPTFSELKGMQRQGSGGSQRPAGGIPGPKKVLVALVRMDPLAMQSLEKQSYLVAKVAQDCGAAKAGIQAGDLIVGTQLSLEPQALRGVKTVELDVYRPSVDQILLFVAPVNTIFDEEYQLGLTLKNVESARAFVPGASGSSTRLQSQVRLPTPAPQSSMPTPSQPSESSGARAKRTRPRTPTPPTPTTEESGETSGTTDSSTDGTSSKFNEGTQAGEGEQDFAERRRRKNLKRKERRRRTDKLILFLQKEKGAEAKQRTRNQRRRAWRKDSQRKADTGQGQRSGSRGMRE